VPITMPCVVNTFGYGKDHDANMLRAISDAAGGLYYFIQSEENVSDSFGDCLGGLLSVVAQNLVLTFESKEYIQSVLTKYHTTTVTPNSNYQVNLGDIQSEEQRDILCSVQFKPIPGPQESTAFISIQLSYYNVLTFKLESIKIDATISRPSEATEKPKPPAAIDLQRNRMKTSEALEKGNVLATAGKMEDGRKTIQATIETMLSSPTAQDPFVKGLVTDLTECLDQMQDVQSYNHGGQQMMNEYCDSHSKQRSNKTKSSNTSYQTNAKVMMQAKFKK